MPTASSSPIVTSLGDFELLIIIAKRHGISALTVGDIAFNLPPQPEAPAKPEYTRTEEPNVDAIAYSTFKQL